MFLFHILEALLAYDHVKIRFIKEKEVILNGNANDKSRWIQLIGPGCLQRVLKGINWLLSLITYTFVKCGCSIYFFLNSAILICRGTDISKHFRESLRIRDNESTAILSSRLTVKASTTSLPAWTNSLCNIDTISGCSRTTSGTNPPLFR